VYYYLFTMTYAPFDGSHCCTSLHMQRSRIDSKTMSAPMPPARFVLLKASNRLALENAHIICVAATSVT